MEPTDLQACKATYERLRPSTAQQVLRFHRMQQTAAPQRERDSAAVADASNALKPQHPRSRQRADRGDQRGRDACTRSRRTAANRRCNARRRASPPIPPTTVRRSRRRPPAAPARRGAGRSAPPPAAAATSAESPSCRPANCCRPGASSSAAAAASSSRRRSRRPEARPESAAASAQPRSEASGRDRCRLTAIAEIASASVTANFRSKNGLCIAVMTSGRTPSSAKNISDRNRRRGQQRQRQHEADRPRAVRVVGGKRSNELIGFHSHCSRSLAVRLASPRCSATRTAPSLIANFAAVSLIEALSTAIDCSTSRWRAGSDCSWAATSLAGAVSGGGLARQRLGEIVDIDENPPAAAAQRIDQLVAGDRKQPGRERRVGVPGMPLQMHRQQNVLHDILGLIDRLPCPRQTAARRGPQHRRDGLEQAMIRRTRRLKWPTASGRSIRPHVRARALPHCNSVDLSICYARKRSITKS